MQTAAKHSTLLLVTAALGAVLGNLAPVGRADAARDPRQPLLPASLSGAELYAASCASCHGVRGQGEPKAHVGFDLPLPDFTDCSFATREPDSDWYAVTHDGGPARGFSELMPAFGDALTHEQLQRTIDHVRTFCEEDAWPRGDLNFPRAMFTEKAFVEDELVLTTSVGLEGPGSVTNELTYETRFGARNQLEITIPYHVRERAADQGGDWTSGIGDLALGLKRVMVHSPGTGSIAALGAEAILPLGNEDEGFGKGMVVFEPWLGIGQDLGADAFVHVQAGGEIPTEDAPSELFWRTALGMSFTQANFGRTWSPIVEVLGKHELEEGKTPDWDVVPQFQVTLNTRQHVMMNLAARLPINNTDERSKQILMYLLWDWFDGGLDEGW
jgi:mono/diheme cytochrome c family protein